MSIDFLPVLRPVRAPWNKGRIIGQKRPLLPRHPEMIGLEFLWPSRIHGSPHLSTRQYARIVRGWVMSIGLEPSAYGTHSMRRTKVAQIYKKTGNLRAVQLLLGHTKMDSTVRYLGVDIEDALTLSEGIDL
ncbi:tyrosine-type recombinase/integrase (plasmid) [Gemmobacter fulvus]|uniref:Tyrosine-type recombinase/integrase n=1 Tax=Gemmobacter fulvus TaxID=2840474 RepID=A0A975PC13_9RHOB|nr:tyrosine-type recombinase/integrase [Gemmobacter fulvus]MBT9247680.1 tyrosine-type recombinase/integrase [Gemmobacter fulvus]QWK92863.1 tyrosine-type recombinase/integrase [Gemmobacter fulvus]